MRRWHDTAFRETFRLRLIICDAADHRLSLIGWIYECERQMRGTGGLRRFGRGRGDCGSKRCTTLGIECRHRTGGAHSVSGFA